MVGEWEFSQGVQGCVHQQSEEKSDEGISLNLGAEMDAKCVTGVEWDMYLHPCHWATHWTGRSWQQVSVQGRKHHPWGSPAHCHLMTSSWWS